MKGVEHNGQTLCSWCDLPAGNVVHTPGIAVDSDDNEFEVEPVIESRIIPTYQITRAYMASLRSTLYGRSWDLNNNTDAAAEWLAKEVDRINAIRNMVMTSSHSVEEVIERARKLEVM